MFFNLKIYTSLLKDLSFRRVYNVNTLIFQIKSKYKSVQELKIKLK